MSKDIVDCEFCGQDHLADESPPPGIEPYRLGTEPPVDFDAIKNLPFKSTGKRKGITMIRMPFADRSEDAKWE